MKHAVATSSELSKICSNLDRKTRPSTTESKGQQAMSATATFGIPFQRCRKILPTDKARKTKEVGIDKVWKEEDWTLDRDGGIRMDIQWQAYSLKIFFSE